MTGQGENAGEWQPASARRRAAARAIDAVVTIVLALAAVMVAGFAAGFVSLYVHGWSGSDDTIFWWFVPFSLLALIPVARYEVTATARRGQTLGKKTMGLRVVVWDEKTAAPVGGAEGVGAGCSIERWAVPHGAGLLAGVVAGTVTAPMIGGYGLLVGADTWLVVSAVIYLTALGDPHRRGWHDKTAGTVVIEAAPSQPAPQSGGPNDETPHRDQPVAPTAARRGFMSIMMCAALVGGALVGGAVFGAIEVVPSIFSSEIDKYDEATRQRHDFGQRVGPDGDACWPDDYWQSRSRVFCDLESIGGLHWDTGDVWVSRSHIYVGSGFMCVLRAGLPRCWEWSPDVPPRPARTPQDEDLHRDLRGIVIADGFACGQTWGSVKSMVICWTVGVDQQTYQQDSHQFSADPRWVLKDASDDSFYVERYQEDETTQGMWRHAFTEDE